MVQSLIIQREKGTKMEKIQEKEVRREVEREAERGIEKEVQRGVETGVQRDTETEKEMIIKEDLVTVVTEEEEEEGKGILLKATWANLIDTQVQEPVQLCLEEVLEGGGVQKGGEVLAGVQGGGEVIAGVRGGGEVGLTVREGAEAHLQREGV